MIFLSGARSNKGAQICFLLLIATALQAADIAGKLIIVDGGPDNTPVELLDVRIRPLDGNAEVSATPNKLGDFVLRDVRPGHYKLRLSMPARITDFEQGSQPANPLDFEVRSQDTRRLSLQLSVADSDVLVEVAGWQSGSDFVAILAPADPMLSLQESCYVNKLSSDKTRFQFLPLGRYRLFIVDSRFQKDVAKYGPRLPNFLTSEAVSVNAPFKAQISVTAKYIDSQMVEEAVRGADQMPVK